MKSYVGKLVSAAAVAGVVLAGPASAATPTLSGCQSTIEKEVVKLEAAIVKGLQACVDGYRKTGLIGFPSSPNAGLAAAAAACEGKLFAVAFPDGTSKSAMQKAYNKLTGPLGVLVKGKCTDNLLAQLGHIREDLAGVEWARIALVRAERDAIQEQLASTTDMADVFQQLWYSDTGGSCPTCEKYMYGGPCAAHACGLGGASGACLDTLSGPDIPLALTGVSVLGSAMRRTSRRAASTSSSAHRTRDQPGGPRRLVCLRELAARRGMDQRLLRDLAAQRGRRHVPRSHHRGAGFAGMRW